MHVLLFSLLLSCVFTLTSTPSLTFSLSCMLSFLSSMHTFHLTHLSLCFSSLFLVLSLSCAVCLSDTLFLFSFTSHVVCHCKSVFPSLSNALSFSHTPAPCLSFGYPPLPSPHFSCLLDLSRLWCLIFPLPLSFFHSDFVYPSLACFSISETLSYMHFPSFMLSVSFLCFLLSVAHYLSLSQHATHYPCASLMHFHTHTCFDSLSCFPFVSCVL